MSAVVVYTVDKCQTVFHNVSRPNPIVDLFTGQCITEGLLNNEQFVNNSQFGAFPVQIEGHAHLHDSLEAAIVNVDIQQEVRPK